MGKTGKVCWLSVSISAFPPSRARTQLNVSVCTMFGYLPRSKLGDDRKKCSFLGKKSTTYVYICGLLPPGRCYLSPGGVSSLPLPGANRQTHTCLSRRRRRINKEASPSTGKAIDLSRTR